MDQKHIQKTIKRISYQIYETNSEENELVLAGIKENGLELATRIQKELKKISDLDVVLIEIKMDKKNPRDKISMSQSISFCENKSVVGFSSFSFRVWFSKVGA